MALLYNQQNEQRKRELQNLYKQGLQQQEYARNKENMWQKGSNALGKVQGGMDTYNKFSSSSGGGFGSKFGGGFGGGNTNGAGNAMGNAGGYVAAAKGAMDVGNDLQRKDYTNAGLDTAKTVAGFFGPWGMAAAAAIQMYQNYKGKKQKKAQEAMAKGMEKLQESEQQANEKKSQAMQGLEEQNAQNEAEVDAMNNQAQQQQSPDALKQELYAQTMYPQYQATDSQNNEGLIQNINGVSQQQQTAVKNPYTSSDSRMSSSPVAQEIIAQMQSNNQPDYSNYNSPYSYEEIQQEMMRRGMR